MIQENEFISGVYIRSNGVIELGKTYQVTKDGKVIAQNNTTTVLTPGQSTAGITDPYYLSIIQAAWTQQIIDNYNNG